MISSLNLVSADGHLNAAAGRTSDSMIGRVVLVHDDNLNADIACGVIRSMIPGSVRKRGRAIVRGKMSVRVCVRGRVWLCIQTVGGKGKLWVK